MTETPGNSSRSSKCKRNEVTFAGGRNGRSEEVSIDLITNRSSAFRSVQQLYPPQPTRDTVSVDRNDLSALGSAQTLPYSTVYFDNWQTEE